MERAEERVVVPVRRVGFGGQSVKSRVDQFAHQTSQVEVESHEVARQAVQHLGVRGGIRGTQIVHRLDQPASEQVIPDEIHLGPRERRVFAARQPVAQRLATIRIWFHLRRVGAEKPGRRIAPRSRVLHLADIQNPHDLVADEFVLVEFVLALVLDDLVVDARTERPTDNSRPASSDRMGDYGIGRTAVAPPGTTFPPSPRASPDPGGPVEVGRRHVVRAALRRHQFPDESIQRLAPIEARANPPMKPLDPFRVEHLFLDAQQVAPGERPTIRERGTRQQAIDQTFPFVDRVVRHVVPRLVSRRQQTEQVEKQTSRERRVIGGRRRSHPQLPPAVEPLAIERVRGGKGSSVKRGRSGTNATRTGVC